MNVFSPSATENFLKCPLYWHLRRTGVTQRRLGRRDLAGMLGTAFAAGIGAYNHARLNGVIPTPALVADCGEIAVSIANQHTIEALDSGMTCEGPDESTMKSLPERARKAVISYPAVDPIPPSWKITDVELTMEEAGNCRLDLACENDLGPIVIDYKTKLTSDDRWLAKDVERWKYSEQRFHYSHFYGRRVGRPVWQFQIILLVLEPKFRVLTFPFPNNQEMLEDWYVRRTSTWARMRFQQTVSDGLGADDGLIEMAAKHHDEYGPCDYRKHCFDHGGDLHTSTMGEYVVKERK